MEHPQTKALNIGNYGCLAMSYLYCVGIDPAEHIKILSDAIDRGVIEKDCTVYSAEKFLEYVTGKRFDVSKIQINDIKDIIQPAPVRYSYIDADGIKHSHFVVVEDGKIVYNPLEVSQCIIKGRPDTARIIKLAK